MMCCFAAEPTMTATSHDRVHLEVTTVPEYLQVSKVTLSYVGRASVRKVEVWSPLVTPLTRCLQGGV
jgi:hypothetical protein